ncbi:MAG: hypothetical protein QGG53_29165 [Planctomycetota bacterium]|nr:hypothetical protein [Planctomycetota bacterium]
MENLSAEPEPRGRVAAEDARIRERGNMQPKGTFSFWTNGVLGDWFLAPKAGPVTLVVNGRGRTLEGEPATLGVELVTIDGGAVPAGRIMMKDGGTRDHELELDVPRGFFGIRLRHLNRVAGEGKGQLRHLILKEIRVAGAKRSPAGLTEYAFFGLPSRRGDTEQDRKRLLRIETENLRVEVNPQTAQWSAEHKTRGCKADGVKPVFHIKGVQGDLSDCEVEHSLASESEGWMGAAKRLTLSYRKPGGFSCTYTLQVSEEGHEVLARMDFTNGTGRKLTISRVGTMAAPRVSLGGSSTDWTAIGDGKRFCDPYETVRDIPGHGPFESWWYLGLKNRKTQRSVLFGNLTNNKGLGRFLLLPGDGTSVRVAAYNDYEAIEMPAGATVTGENTLLHFGEKGTDGLDRFGKLIARANKIDLRRDHPIDHLQPHLVGMFTKLNNYGSGVVRGFPYKHDKTKGAKAFMDRAWATANFKKLRELGLGKYGYGASGRIRSVGAGTPLVRRYGKPDFWFKEAKKIAEDHPEYYINDRIDFSNSEVQAFEKARLERGFKRAAGAIARYGWDFSDLWAKLPGQYDPFMTSAETYRLATGLWRDAGRRHPQGAYAFVWMNIIGISYDRIDVIHIGADSDQAYYGQPCSFTQGLTRQISGRYFYNGNVWWNSPDSFHVYCGGIYSYRQGKVHASFCSISGNLVHLGEPLVDEDIPEDRIEIIRRVSPVTADVSKAVDVFEHNPARLWNLPVRRSFGRWNIAGFFNLNYKQHGKAITEEIRFDDLELDPSKDYLVYEFWSKQFLGIRRGGFERTLEPVDCEIYSIVERQNHPALISTNRHVRQMAVDVLDLKWDAEGKTLSGRSAVVGGDPYELRIFVPQGFNLGSAKAGDLRVSTKVDAPLATVRFSVPENQDVGWSVRFQ